MKKLLTLVMVTVMLTACGSKELKVETPKTVNAEYGEELNKDKLFDVKKSDEKIKVKKVEDFDKNKVGEQLIKVTFTDGKIETTKEIKIAIKDTKKPIIELNKKEIKIQVGDKLDIKKNIKKVSDPVDGELKYSDKEIKENGYMIDNGKLDLDKAGTYEVKVIAYDKNKNKSETTFKVIVEKKKETPKQESSEVSEPSNQQVSQNTNAGQNSYQEPSKPSAPASSNNKPAPSKPQEKPNTCRVGVVPAGVEIGNSGMTFMTMEEADAWARKEWNTEGSPWADFEKWSGYSILNFEDECGNDVFSVDFYK